MVQQGVPDDPDELEAQAGPKAWRWVGEMEEAADTVAAVGVPDGFSRSAAEMYRRMAQDHETGS